MTYKCLIDKLIYLSCEICSDIVFVVEQLSYYNLDLQASHFCIAKQILFYLKKMITLGIKQEKDSIGYQLGGKYREFDVVRYMDSSYASDLEDRKSIVEYCFFLKGVIVIWYSKQQRIISMSTLEAKYVVIS